MTLATKLKYVFFVRHPFLTYTYLLNTPSYAQVAPARILGILKFIPNVNVVKNVGATLNVPMKTITLPIIWWMSYESKRKKIDRACALPSVKFVMDKKSRALIQLVEMPFVVGPAAAYPFADDKAGESSLTEASSRRYWFMPLRMLRRCRSEVLPFIKGATMDMYPNLRPNMSGISIYDKEEALKFITQRADSNFGSAYSSAATYGAGAAAKPNNGEIGGRDSALFGISSDDAPVRRDAVLDVQEKVPDHFDDDSEFESDDDADSVGSDD
jgi:hypothetical protein